jgi:small subunit ribosomal protein S1
MVNDINPSKTKGGPPPVDESWWAALLADEEKSHEPSIEYLNQKTEQEISSQQGCVNWSQAKMMFEQDETIDLNVTGYNRGGLLVEGEDIQGFVPISHLIELSGEKLDEDRDQLLSDYIGRSLLLKVIECDPDRGRVVLSERAALAEPGKRNQLLDSLQCGMHVWGTVTNITDFGVFVDLGGLEGLVHVSELSWGRVRHPADTVNLGQKIEVFVINVDGDRSRVALSLKRLYPNPWETVEDRYQSGQITQAVITSILPFGAFARLEEGLDGLIHVSEMMPSREAVKPNDLLFEGQSVQVRILQVDADRQRLGLSLCLEEESKIIPTGASIKEI